MNAFEKHGIKHLSASSLALYRNQPSLWVLKYLYGVKDEAGPAAWRGSAVEAGTDRAVMQPDIDFEACLNIAMERFEQDAQGETSNEIERERAVIKPMLAQAIDLLRPLGIPLSRQLKISCEIPGIEVPVIGYVDYVYPDLLVDLKTTHRMPTDPRPDHAVQVAIYSAAKQCVPKLAYVTGKKAELRSLTDEQLKQGWWTATKSAHAVQALLSSIDRKEQAAALFVPDFQSFYWSEELIAEALTVAPWR